MKTRICMVYKDVVTKRLARKREQLKGFEQIIAGGGEITSTERRKYIECKAAILELENIIDLAESLFESGVCDQAETK